MDLASLPHFCRKESSKSSRHSQTAATAACTENCFSFDHAYHQQLYNYIKQQAMVMESITPPIRQVSFCLDLPEPDPDDARIAKTIETQFHKLENQNGLVINGNWISRGHWFSHLPHPWPFWDIRDAIPPFFLGVNLFFSPLISLKIAIQSLDIRNMLFGPWLFTNSTI